MPDTLDARAKSVIDQVIDLEGTERTESLERECAGNLQLRSRVESLLASMEKDDAFLRQPTVSDVPAPRDPAALERPGSRIGPYTLVELIGEGGFGSVYLAEQSEPVRRHVALKIIKLGMDTRQVIARFDAERQALALMDHPNIARVLDAGATDGGRPYFVMELVRGELVTGYCDRERLPIRERLELFRDVCHAVQHAHQKGVIHRDIKPSNVLVTVVDGRAIPKVIDFGIAKATAGRLTEMTLHTEVFQMIGTPDYMSPEQAESSGADIDTRSDVYSLGVLLFELLTGLAPFDRQRLRSAPFAEMRRIVREEEAPRPSLRLATLPESSGHFRLRTPAGGTGVSPGSSMMEIAQCRRTEPISLTRAIRGDLDWIVLKCLEKDRSRRYETASALSEDVRRHLDQEPVTACPPHAAYKLRKFINRHRGAVASGAVVAAALVVATGVSFSFGISEARHRKTAELDKARAEKAEAETKVRANELEQAVIFQKAQLAGIDAKSMGARLRADLLKKAQSAAARSKLPPGAESMRATELEKLIAGTDFTGMALDALDVNFFQPALQAIERQFASQPLVKAQLLQSLADTLLEVGLLAAATEPQADALAIRREALGDDHPDTLASISGMGLLIHAQGKSDQAEPYYRDALEKRRRVLGDEHPDTLRSIHNLASLLQAQNKLAEAEPLYREALEKRRRILGEENRDTLTSIASMGYFLNAQGKRELAEPYYREALEKRRRVLGDEHPHTLFSINNMGALFQLQGRFSEAQELYIEALEKRRSTLGDNHPDTLQSINNLGNVLQAQKKLDEAEPYYREALEIRRRVLGDDHPHTLNSIANMGTLLQDEGKLIEAEAYTREALERRRRLLPDDHPETLISINNMAVLLDLQGKHVEAEGLYREALEKLRRVHGDDHQYTFMTIMSLSSLLKEAGKHAEAAELLAAAEPTARRKLPAANDPRIARFLCTLGRARAAAREFNAAESNLTEAHALLSETQGARSQDRLDILTGLVELYDAQHAAEPDKGHEAKATEWRERLEQLRATSSQPSDKPQ